MIEVTKPNSLGPITGLPMKMMCKLLLAIVFATVDARFANAMRGAGSTIGRQAGTRSFDRCAAHARIKLKGLFCQELMFDGSPFVCSPLAGSR